MRYILYARKSSENDDPQVKSRNDEQLRLLRELAGQRGLHIVEEITESRSATTPWVRPGVERMLKRVEQGQADAILCWSIDRMTRSPVVAGRLMRMLQNNVLKAIQTIDRQFLPSDDARFNEANQATDVVRQDLLTLHKNEMQQSVRAGRERAKRAGSAERAGNPEHANPEQAKAGPTP